MTPNNVSITPLASRLLHRPEERQSSAYNEAAPPIVYDMTPNILGPAEGFQQAGCVIDNAFSFDEEHNVTWKVRNGPKQRPGLQLIPVIDKISPQLSVRWFGQEYHERLWIWHSGPAHIQHFRCRKNRSVRWRVHLL